MDALTFIVEISKALAWPVVVVISLVLFRASLSQLLLAFASNPYFRAKWNGKELEIGTREAKKLSETIQMPPEERRFVEAVSEAPISPKVAIVEAWRDVEATATAALGITAFTSNADLETALESSKILDKEKFRLFTDLLQLRNKAVHIPERAISTNTAVEYSEAAHKLAAYIRAKKKAS